MRGFPEKAPIPVTVAEIHSAHSETGRRVTGRRCAVVAFWALLVVFLSALWALNIRPQADADDILKLAQLRHVLETGVLTDRVVPQVLQPEVMVSHWTWIADAPYLLITLVMTPLLGQETALAVAIFIVPPTLLLVALALLFRIVVELDFDDSTMAFLLVAALTTFVEFQPGRIDYHNIQMVLLLATLLLSMQAGRLPALANGAVTALSFSISPELAIFVALTMAIYACRFCWGATGARQEIAAYGGSLAASALALFLPVVPPSAYFAPVCDQFALGHLVALVGAGVSFVAVASLPAGMSPLIRGASIAAGAMATGGVILIFFPQCLAGPYGAMSDYAYANFLAPIEQEKSIFASETYFLSGNLAVALLIFCGPLAACLVVLTGVARARAWVVYALFAGAGAVHAMLYLRYLRFLPWIAGPGLLLLVSRLLPEGVELGRRLRVYGLKRLPSRAALLLPALAVGAVITFVHLIRPAASTKPLGAELAAFCAGTRGDAVEDLRWPEGARVLAPPALGISMLRPHGPALVSIPFHRASAGLERTYRFFDPSTADPRGELDRAKATHVVVCAYNGVPNADYVRDYPLAMDLVVNRPPSWLRPCAIGSPSRVRVYAFDRADGARMECPMSN
ncbi:MAG TPA: hypothetical protein VIU14_14305 [Mesorhizobium sp.]